MRRWSRIDRLCIIVLCVVCRRVGVSRVLCKNPSLGPLFISTPLTPPSPPPSTPPTLTPPTLTPPTLTPLTPPSPTPPSPTPSTPPILTPPTLTTGFSVLPGLVLLKN